MSRYIEQRSSGHRPLITRFGTFVAHTLLRLDRGRVGPLPIPPLILGAQITAELSAPAQDASAAEIVVGTPAEIVTAVARVRPGDVVALLPGTYHFDRRAFVEVSRGGTEAAPITVRAQRRNTVVLEFDMSEGFRVSAPYWIFEHLHIRGVCMQHQDCEHAFHVVGKAMHFVARDNSIVDFNAHFKVNGENGAFPDDGRIEGNTLVNSSVRQTENPVSPVDLVGVSRWQVRRNLISDFVKGQGNQISYGAFAKGGGSENIFAENIVVCEALLRGAPGQRVGISLGGGGSDKAYCRDQHCVAEHHGGTIDSNLVQSCSDDGIYINRAAASSVSRNTLIDTSGIAVRFSESSAEVRGNLVDGLIRARDGASMHATDNFDTGTVRLYLGSHPVLELFDDAGAMFLGWSRSPPRRGVADASGRDLCNRLRSQQPTYGAFEDFSACRLPN